MGFKPVKLDPLDRTVVALNLRLAAHLTPPARAKLLGEMPPNLDRP
jgi:hypothetical protein